MKKLVCLALSVLFAIVLVSCAKATPELAKGMLKPGDKIGNMTVEEHAMSTKYPEIWDYCAYQPEEKEPDTQTIDCDIPVISRMEIGFGWGAEDITILDSNWAAMAWELHIDGYQINLDEFGQWSENGRPDLGVCQSARGWILDLNNLSPGKHTLRYLWTSEISIDDGFDVYAPGTYEHIVNFTVLEE
jgi:hypothetical protein